MYVMEKRSGMAFCFDLETRSWKKDKDCKLYSRIIRFVGDLLIMDGITGDEDNPMGIEFWEVESNESMMRSIGSMPTTCLEKLRGIDSDWTSIALNAAGDTVYVYDATVAGDIVAARRWKSRIWRKRWLKSDSQIET
ncbi:hypothetical protein AALP_AA6G310200 [Arabis alpina]|uniref:F-box associated domain-containing protein n=1 Tax=Arabis alpina TaxID=50452 RepID=A0A087GSU6_ARAAL|nr:hypothetical protein AALP_AA6G310200 [Arabis alpina]